LLTELLFTLRNHGIRLDHTDTMDEKRV